MTKARVLFDLGILATGTRNHGVGRYVTELARGLVALQAQWDDLEIVFLERVGLDGSIRIAHELEPALARLRAKPAESRYRWSYPIRLFAGRAATSARAELVHLPLPNATPLVLGGARTVVTCHDLIPYRFPDHYGTLGEGFGWGRRALDRRRYRSAGHVLAISHATANDLHALLGLTSDKVSVVLSGIDAARWSATEEPGDAAQLASLGLRGRRFLIYVGDGDWRKNSVGMFSGLAQARRVEPDLELIWCGKLSPERLRLLRAQAESLGVEEACTFLGYVSDSALRALYRNALATLFVSHAEGFGYPVLEAMASGCPVITSNVSSLPEVAGNAALCVDPESAAQIGDAILSMTQNSKARERLKTSGLERAKSFTLERQALGTLDVYRRQLRVPLD
jgi:glycosyltransferase involved in cell wall biosynthesis